MTYPTWSKQESDECGKEGARPSSLIPVHKLSMPDELYDLQLQRDMAIVNARAQRELGPMPLGGLPAVPKRKPKSWRHDEPGEVANQENVEDETMKLSHLAMTAALSVATIASPMACGSGSDHHETEAAMSADSTSSLQAHEPDWPDNGIAERHLEDAQNMFVELDNGTWKVWVLSNPPVGKPAYALEFFSGQIEQVKLKYGEDDEPRDEFIDASGHRHKSVEKVYFAFKGLQRGGGIGDITFGVDSIDGLGALGSVCHPSLDVAERDAPGTGKPLWRKIPLYLARSNSLRCPNGVWNSDIFTALDLKDGTMLVTMFGSMGSEAIFRLRQDDLSPVGSAPSLHVVDEEQVKAVVQQAQGKTIDDPNAYLTEKLNLSPIKNGHR